MKPTALLCLSVLFIQSCAFNNRFVASVDLVPPPLDDLLKASETIAEDVTNQHFPEACVSYLSRLEKSIDDLDIKSLPRKDLLKHAEAISDNSWKIRTGLHKRLSEFDQPCVYQIQSSFRQFRFIEDYLLEMHNQVTHVSPTPKDFDFSIQPIPMMDQTPSFYVTKMSGEEKEIKFETGDMLVTRGVSFLSAMIARLGDRGTQFSHIVWVDKNAKGEIKTIESYVGVGVAFYEIQAALRNENARILWLRAKDKNLSKIASEKISKLVSDALENDRPIKYDYELNFEDPKTMSCAEVSQVAFQLASDGKFRIPYYPNSINGGKSLTERLKIESGPTYEPGDMEIDPRFELVGEFKDLRLTRDSRQKDAVLSAMFRWMNEAKYELKDSLKSKMAGGLIYNIRRTFLWPLVKKVLKLNDFSKEVPRNMVKTVALIDQVAGAMFTELKARDEAFEKEHGVPMTAVGLSAELEKMRLEDLEKYENRKTRKKAIFHKWFRQLK